MKHFGSFFITGLMTVCALLPQTAYAATDAGAALNKLLRTEKDAQDGYFASAQQAQSAELKNLFLSLSNERKGFVEALDGKVEKLGDIPEEKGTLEGAAYRGWIDVKTALSNNDDRAVLAEVAKVEAVAVDRYNDTLQENLPDDVRSIVNDQAGKVRSAQALAEYLADATGNKIATKDAIQMAKEKGLDVRG